MNFYTDTLDGINNTKHYIKSETMDAMNGIWQDAKPTVQQFFEDLKNIAIIEQDVEELGLFLNSSYEANDFYIKDIMTITLMIFDELALKSHLQTLPKIVQEIWSMMGESGQKIRKSILWAVEEVSLVNYNTLYIQFLCRQSCSEFIFQIKIYYKNTTDFVHELINGDPVANLSSGLEKLLEKYDKFMKNLHIATLHYIETLWYQTYDLMINYWHTFLAGLEPTFLKFIHYLESAAWNTGKDFLGKF